MRLQLTVLQYGIVLQWQPLFPVMCATTYGAMIEWQKYVLVNMDETIWQLGQRLTGASQQIAYF